MSSLPRATASSFVFASLALIGLLVAGPGPAHGQAGAPVTLNLVSWSYGVEIVRDISEHGYDLTVIGALGIGRSRDSQIGSVCERVCRHAAGDVMLVSRPSGRTRRPRAPGRQH